MGRYFIKLDPSGYNYPSEPGFDFELTGAEWLQQMAATPDQIAVSAYAANFWNPPGTPWVMCKPKQLNPDWVRDGDLGDYVIPKADWTFMSGLTANEYEQSA